MYVYVLIKSYHIKLLNTIGELVAKSSKLLGCLCKRKIVLYLPVMYEFRFDQTSTDIEF